MGVTASRGRLSRAAMIVAIWCAEILLLFVLAEGISAFFLPAGPRFYYPQKLIIPHASRVYTNQPNQRAYTIDQDFWTNSVGFRDEREIRPEKDGEFRILSLGDSMAEGLGVAAESTYARQLERQLSAKYAPVRVINAAIGCYSTFQEVDLLNEVGLRFQPDVVVLQFYWNDLYVTPEKIVPLPTSQAGDVPEARRWYLRLLKRSRVLSFLREKAQGAWYSRYPSFDWAHQQMIYEGRTNPYLDRAYNDVAAAMARFKQLADTHGFKPVLVVLPMSLQVLRPNSRTELQRRVKAIADELDLPVLDPLAELQREAAGGADIFIAWDHSHFTPHGHRVIAALLEKHLSNNGLLPRR